jgi:hypothetical protein
VVLYVDRAIAPTIADHQEVGLPDPLAHMIRGKPTSDDHRDLAFDRFGGDGLQLLLGFCRRGEDARRNLLQLLDSGPLEFSPSVEAPL